MKKASKKQEYRQQRHEKYVQEILALSEDQRKRLCRWLKNPVASKN